jgi:hypothetical protein
VVVEVGHECMTTRGVHKPGVTMVASCLLGTFRTQSGNSPGVSFCHQFEAWVLILSSQGAPPVTGMVLRCSPVPELRLHGKSSRVTPSQAVQYFAEHGQCACVLDLAASCGVLTKSGLGENSASTHPSADLNVGDHRQVIGDDARASIDEARPHRVRGPAENTVETKERIPGRKGRILRPCWQLASERAAQ